MNGILLILFNISLIYGYEPTALEIPKGISHEVLLEPGDKVSIKICKPKKLLLKTPKIYPDIKKNLVYISKSVRATIPLNLLIRGNAFSFDTSNLKSCIIRMEYRDDVPLTATRRLVDFLFYYDDGTQNLSEINKKYVHVTLKIKDMYNYGCDFSFSGVLDQSIIIDVSNVKENPIHNKKSLGNSDKNNSNIIKKRSWAIMKLFKIFGISRTSSNVSQKQRVGSEITNVIEKGKISKICSISLKTLPSRSFSFYCPGHLYPPNCFEEAYIRNEDGTFEYKKIDGARTHFGHFTRRIRVKNIKKNFERGTCECVVGNERYLMDVEA